jgi:uncharacterized SAM-binding protein YcdF (DUF218 family)
MANKKPITFIICLLIIISVTGWIAFKNLALWLVVSDPVPQSLDALFTFGEEDSRVAYSQSLFLKNPQAIWVISSENKKLIRTLGKEGLDTSRIIIVDTCKNTYSEISFLNNWIAGFIKKRAETTNDKKVSHVSDKIDLPKIGLVSNWYHMRRIKLIASRKISKKQCTLLYFSVPLSKNERAGIRNNWWNDKIVSSIVYSEWWKILYYQFMTCKKGTAKNPLGFSVWTTAYGRGVMLNVAASQQLFLLLPPLRGLLKATR